MKTTFLSEIDNVQKKPVSIHWLFVQDSVNDDRTHLSFFLSAGFIVYQCLKRILGPVV